VIIRFCVLGTAQTAGSKRGFIYKSKKDGKQHVAISDDNPKGQSWKHAVACSAREVHSESLLDGPLAVTMRFYRPRPKGHFGKSGLSKAGAESPWPAGRPDVLKLARCSEDALSGVIWRDDAQIVEEHLFKHWGEPARMEIEIREVERASVGLFDSVKLQDMPAPWEKTR